MRKRNKSRFLNFFIIYIFPLSLFFVLNNTYVEAKIFRHKNQSDLIKNKVQATSADTDEFGSSALENTILGPTLKYPKPPSEVNSSSQRHFSGGQVNTLPFQSPAEALEIVPGLAVGR